MPSDSGESTAGSISEVKPFNFPPKEADPGKESRIQEYLKLLKTGIPRGELTLHKRYEVSNDQMLWDCQDADDLYRQEMLAFGAKDLSVRAHIQERVEIGQKAKKNGELNIALDAIKDVARLQGLYEERSHVDSKVEFVFSYQIPETIKPAIDITPRELLGETTKTEAGN